MALTSVHNFLFLLHSHLKRWRNFNRSPSQLSQPYKRLVLSSSQNFVKITQTFCQPAQVKFRANKKLAVSSHYTKKQNPVDLVCLSLSRYSACGTSVSWHSPAIPWHVSSFLDEPKHQKFYC